MKRLSLLVVALSLLISLSGAHPTTAQIPGPDDTVRRFYVWYLSRLNKDDFSPLKNRAVALQYLTPEFLKRVPKLTEQQGADVIICAQDFDPLWEKNVKVEPPTITGARATTLVRLEGKEVGTVKLKVTLKQITAGWRIDSVECAE